MLVNEQTYHRGMSVGGPSGNDLLDQLRERLGTKTTEALVRAVGDPTAANLKTHGGYMPINQIYKWMNLALGVDPLDHASVFSVIDTSAFVNVGGERLSWFETSQDNLVKHTEGAASDKRSKVETGERELTPVKSKLLFEPTYEFLEESIQADPTGQLFMAVMGQLYRNDAARLIWMGDTDSTNGTLAIHDGLIKKMKDAVNYPGVHRIDDDSNIDGYAADSSKTLDCLDKLMDKVLETEDGQYSEMPGFSIFCSRSFLSHYKRMLRDRGSGTLESGARKLQFGDPRNVELYEGIPVRSYPYFPNDFLCAAPVKIFTWKYVKQMMIEHDRDINAQKHLFVMSQQHNCDIKNDKPVFALYNDV